MTSTPSTHDTDMLVHDDRRKRQILFASCAALMAVIASVTGLNVAQQELALDFGASQSTVLWIINAYALALAAMLMPVGAIGDRWGRKPVLLAGLAVFVVATAAAAFAPSSTFMIIVRVVAGVSAAMIMPVTLSVITSTFPEEERAQAIGVWAGVAGGGGLIGMFVAALMVDLVDWRWLFVLPIALAVVAAVATVRAVPNSREQTDQPFDLQGSLLSMVAVSGLVFAIHEGPVHGWSDSVTLLALLGGLLATLGFVVTERRSPAPLLDVRVFGDRRLATGSVALIVLFGVLGGVFIVLFPYFQGVLGWSALRSTAALLPMGLLMMASSGLAPKLATAVGNRTTSLAGIGIAGGGLATMAMLVSVDGGYLSVLPGMLVIGTGMGLTMTPSTEAITASLPADRQGVASALNDTTRERAVGGGALRRLPGRDRSPAGRVPRRPGRGRRRGARCRPRRCSPGRRPGDPSARQRRAGVRRGMVPVDVGRRDRHGRAVRLRVPRRTREGRGGGGGGATRGAAAHTLRGY